MATEFQLKSVNLWATIELSGHQKVHGKVFQVIGKAKSCAKLNFSLIY